MSSITPPGTKSIRWMILGGVLLGLSYPPLPLGPIAVIAFVPFFLLMEPIDTYWKAIRYAYGFIFIFNLITLYWPGGFIHGKDGYLMIAGLAVIFLHPLFFLITIPPFIFIKKHFNSHIAILTFPLLWVGFEYLHSLTEYSFPWVLLGYTQTYNLLAIQFASFTGVYGISLWLMYINVGFYFLYIVLLRKHATFKSPGALWIFGCIILLYIVPQLYGMIIINHNEQKQTNPSKLIKIGVIQPNIDPFDKWTVPPKEQIAILESMTVQAVMEPVKLIVWPETAIPSYILPPGESLEYVKLEKIVDTLNILLLTGVPDIHYYTAGSHIPKSAMTSVSGARYDSYNSTVLLTPRSEEIQKYHKIHLVPYAERVPYSEFLSILNAMKWNFGLGGWGIGSDTTIFHFVDRGGREYRFANAICYESIYPGFIAEFVKKGAEFITVITNDSWWGNTSGVYQHEQIGRLRAVENRRWVVQCSNGGISCFIDPYGRILNKSNFDSRCIINQDIEPLRELTFYTIHGDWLADSCLILSAFILTAGMGKKCYQSIKRQGFE
ncbi:MAG: apolipoprotein N-acyltransferase [Bacteroidota bacterium]